MSKKPVMTARKKATGRAVSEFMDWMKENESIRRDVSERREVPLPDRAKVYVEAEMFALCIAVLNSYLKAEQAAVHKPARRRAKGKKR